MRKLIELQRNEKDALAAESAKVMSDMTTAMLQIADRYDAARSDVMRHMADVLVMASQITPFEKVIVPRQSGNSGQGDKAKQHRYSVAEILRKVKK